MNRFARFGALAAAVTAALLLVGVWWTRSAPAGFREAMVSAVAVVFVGSMIGAVPLVLGSPAKGEAATSAPVAGPAGVSKFLATMILRMGAVVVGALAVVVLGDVPLEPFLLWLAVSYLAFLIVDTAFALQVFRSL